MPTGLIIVMILVAIAGVVWFKKAKEREKAKDNKPPTDVEIGAEQERAADEALLEQLQQELAETPTGVLQQRIDILKVKLGIY